MEKAEDFVYEKNEIFDRKSFENQVQKLSKIDPEIKDLSISIKSSYDKALKGQYEILELNFP